MAGQSLPTVVHLAWYGKQVNLSVSAITKRRVKAATAYLFTKVLDNISVPVGRITGPRGGITKIRSKPGEFPRKDFENLVNTLQSGVSITAPGVWDGWVGSPLDYSVFLELGTKRMARRPFLTRTLFEESAAIKAILVAPMTVSNRKIT